MSSNDHIELESVVIRFSGDSGDGMQLTGTQFSNTSALMGNDISTFPDYPAEIRAPQGTIAGVSGFQVHFGSNEVITPGDEVDMLVALNPAALKANLGSLRKGGTILANTDAFTYKGLEKATYTDNPLEDNSLSDYQVIEAPIDSQTLDTLEDHELDLKNKKRCKNFYALGICYFLYHRDITPTIDWINEKFKKFPELAQANIATLKSGYHFAETLEAVVSTYKVPSAKITPGKYRQINGNTSTAWGFLRAAQAAKLPLFLGSYPITPATDILHELSKHKNFGVKTFQAEDEIAAICCSIGAGLAGNLALTTSSGPGIALKGEAIGLAVTYEMPLVIVNVQRGGPSTGLPTKTEQSDLYQALYGRNGEAPLIILAASRPNDCFHMAYEASRLALQHMSPVMLLTDGYIANGTEPWRIPDVDKHYNEIKHNLIEEAPANTDGFKWIERDEVSKVRKWAIPGTKGLEHRIGGLEKDYHTGDVSYDPINHELMTNARKEKIERVVDNIPEQELEGDSSGDLLVVSWGGTYGAVQMAVKQLQKEGVRISLMHMKYINPIPKNVPTILKNFNRIIVPELNGGQLINVLKAKYSIEAIGYNKMQGLPFKISELVEEFKKAIQ
ncbi:2-oxoacid:acceptor oxidoreductase subunit alpha [Halobacteriovorax sp. HLS]|uniref:2-oxoacid:acceptor oxidoreductase subunit alpha n=1 Tax=Halobacteriovorax sp. HLS TaxID=2234000 RepID=UPI000FD78BF7|nr:2-oxoacid:acceptor oxidoreductase subunit alpha [Halobacteriovorax sp. HLS]